MSGPLVVKPETNEEQGLTVQPAVTMRDQPAGFVSRLLAFVIDLFIITATTTVAAIAFGLILNFFNLNFLVSPPSTNEDSLITVVRVLLLILGIGANFLFVNGYLVLFWYLTGQTPGKSFLGLRVGSRDGRPLRGNQAVRRLIGYWFSALPLFAGFLWVLIDDSREGWHDKFAGTHVVYDWEARMGQQLVEAMRDRRRRLESTVEDKDS